MLPTDIKIVCHGTAWWGDLWHQRPGYELDLIPRYIDRGDRAEVVWGPFQVFLFWDNPTPQTP